MEFQSETELKTALNLMELGQPDQALQVLDESLVHDLENTKLIYTQKCCLFWRGVIYQISKIDNPYEKGENILSEWKNFLGVIEQQKITHYAPAYYAICRGVFNLALQNYSCLLDEKNPVQRSEILRKTGLCYKKLGEFDNAKNVLAEANSILPGQADVIAELADCFALCGDDKAAKVLFREAFFLDYKKIDLSFLDSNLIKLLIEKTAEKGYSGDLLKAWIPVYGVILGVFNMKRTLNAKEIGKLRQDIHFMENEMKDPSRTTEFHVPRLFNMYFWFIDYCQSVQDDKAISEILLKMKILDTTIYNLYI